ncbi:MAG: hypothetical protein MPW16_20275 [Candidatus Manganitrophus sp.]|nr:MAG: hypothetical protein MPW16_20275 [Candidatus Manganitrophus sp.]
MPGAPTIRTPFGIFPPNRRYFSGLLEKFDDLHQLRFCLVDAGDIVEGDFCLLLHVDLRLALADLHHPAGGSHPSEEKRPETEEKQGRDDPGEKGHDPGRLHLSGVLHLHPVQLFDQRGILNACRHKVMFAPFELFQLFPPLFGEKPLHPLRMKPAGNVALPQCQVRHFPRFQKDLEFAVGKGLSVG